MTKQLDKEIQILINKYKFGNFTDVLDKCSLLVKKYPKNDFLWNLAGLSFQRIGDIKNSITSFQNAIDANQKNYSAKNNLAISYKNNQELEKAEKLLNELIKQNPDYINALVNLANLKNETYFFEEAISIYKKVLKINKAMPELHLNISNILQAQNKMEEAKNHLQQALELNPLFTTADQNLSMLINYKSNDHDDHLNKMINKLDNSKLTKNDLINLHFGIGKAFEDKKDYEKSFKHFEKGNKIKDKSSKFSINFFKQMVIDLKKYFSKLDLKKINNHQDKGNKIFILGLPRSGTTLLEKIISSHAKVGSVSEIGYFYDLVNKNIFLNKKLNTNKVNSLLYQNLNKRYDNFLSSYNIQKEFIIDKTLTNFWYIGFIRIFFPNSKIIHSFRNPKDNCLSIYKNLFKTNEAWLYDQEKLGEYYLLYKEMMEFWNEIFEGEIYNNKYEDLINNKEEKIKEIIKFCGLEWDENCLDHQKNTNPIKTLSINQANKPIYKTSINSSKFYEDKLSKLFSSLDKLT